MKVRKAVFPVAGLGTRFLPATKVIPKEMLAVVDTPLIQWAVEEAWQAGIEEIILVTGRGKSLLVDQFDHMIELEDTLRKKGKNELLNVSESTIPCAGSIVATRQQEPQGLGHAVWCARHLVGDEPFAVILPDDFVHHKTGVLMQMIERFEELQAGMMAVMEVAPEDTNKYGVIDAGAEREGVWPIQGLVEKPAPEKSPSNLAIIGRYILPPQIFNLLEQQGQGAGGEIQLTDAMASLLKDEPLYGFRFEGTRYDCGDKAGFQMANMALALERDDMRDKLLPFMAEQLKQWS
uniref:UTP--glucose-1-phosphate uridylyltransferase n=1 Tax=Magnetococcus massalia (strain MO-1) TaxID=451514 RepID=A0A1S7LNE0_MAGMO|nr:Glucose-1-phosphate uridylyltransferase [Candidatus Magnetococcus massalia]